MSRTFMRGLSEENGSWNTTCTLPAQRSQLAGGHVVDPLAVQIHLALGRLGYSRRIALPTVDLPQPDSPTSDSVSPRLMSNVTPSTA